MGKPRSSSESGSSNQATADRYPTLRKAVTAIINESENVDTTVERVEIFLHASGDATYRMWPPRSDEFEGGHISPDKLS